MSSNWFPTNVYCFHECLPTQFWLFALNVSVRTDTEHQGNHYPAARNSASPPETFTQQLNTPGIVTILQGAYGYCICPQPTPPYKQQVHLTIKPVFVIHLLFHFIHLKYNIVTT